MQGNFDVIPEDTIAGVGCFCWDGAARVCGNAAQGSSRDHAETWTRGVKHGQRGWRPGHRGRTGLDIHLPPSVPISTPNLWNVSVDGSVL